jgi:hypothetical protein
MLGSIAGLAALAAATVAPTADLNGHSAYTEDGRKVACSAADRILLIPTPLSSEVFEKWSFLKKERGLIDLETSADFTPPPGAHAVGCDGAGRFSISGVPAGRYTLVSVIADGKVQHVVWKQIDLTAGQPQSVDVSATVYVIG